MQPPFLKDIRLIPERVTRKDYPFDLPFLAKDDFALRLTSAVTILVGENGCGKSTLLEAIAAQCGFHAAGGSRDHNYQAPADACAELSRALRLSWLPKVSQGFFFRADSFFALSNYVDDLAERWPDMRQHYGERALTGQSHGESFLALFRNRLGSKTRAIYVLDEPEAALSPRRQLALLEVMAEWQRSGTVQVIMATHSPLLMSLPGACVLQMEGATVRQVDFTETDHYRVMKAFFSGEGRVSPSP